MLHELDHPVPQQHRHTSHILLQRTVPGTCQQVNIKSQDRLQRAVKSLENWANCKATDSEVSGRGVCRLAATTCVAAIRGHFQIN